MCLVIFAYRSHPDFPLVVAANRDEFYTRATRVAGFWQEHPALLAGRDLEQGGTWMGVTRNGRFAAITNFRDPERTVPAPRSRGQLTLDYLKGNTAAGLWIEAIAGDAPAYAGFNLLLGDGGEMWYASNSAPGQAMTTTRLQPGVFGLSNARLDTPWPKVCLGKQRLTRLLAGGQPLNHDSLLQVVNDPALADPQALHPLGLDQQMDRLLSAQFITAKSYGYGTRSSTTFWTDAAGTAHWRELSFDAEGAESARCEAEFSLSPPPA
jgi:uncharacterized protein with NRDE domain